MLHLEKVNGSNVKGILDLKVKDSQSKYVADNSMSLIEAYIAITSGGHAFPFGIYEDNKAVGFLMIGFGIDDDWKDAPEIAMGNYCLWRLMIDEKYQNMGYGRKAAQLALEFIHTFPCGKAPYCWVSYAIENKVAHNLYHSFGFEENGDIDGTEMIAVRKLFEKKREKSKIC